MTADRFIGSSVTDTLQKRVTTPLVSIGNDHFFRTQFATLGFFADRAASNLSKQIAEHYPHIKNTKELYERVSPNDLTLPGLGAFTIAALGPIYQLKKIGGEKPLDAWALKHRKGNGDALVSFNALKHRSVDMKAEAQERKQKKQRRQKRRDRAHETRVDRFETRTNANAADSGVAGS